MHWLAWLKVKYCLVYFRYIGEQQFRICLQQVLVVCALCFASVGTTADNGGSSSIPFFVTGFPLAVLVSQHLTL